MSNLLDERKLIFSVVEILRHFKPLARSVTDRRRIKIVITGTIIEGAYDGVSMEFLILSGTCHRGITILLWR